MDKLLKKTEYNTICADTMNPVTKTSMMLASPNASIQTHKAKDVLKKSGAVAEGKQIIVFICGVETYKLNLAPHQRRERLCGRHSKKFGDPWPNQ